MPPLSFLVVDDDPHIRESLSFLLLKEGHLVAEAGDGAAALASLERERTDAAILDVGLPGMSGMELFRRMREDHPLVEILFVTGTAGVPEAVEALKGGAFDFLQKPWRNDALLATVRRLAERIAARRSASAAPAPRAVANLVGDSPEMARVRELAARLRDDPTTVLILGETGTGKEEVARALHFGGARAAEPFLVVDCGALTPGLIESELFGHRKGAFTGADRDRPGLLESAGRGTLFLDEIGEIPLALQSRLLRALQEREIRPIGGQESRPLAARVVAATNRDLSAEVREGRFREDLFYRLYVVVIRVAPLRERREDILPLARHFISKMRREGRPVEGITPEAEAALLAHAWPGNVRELGNAVAHAFAVGQGPLLRREDLPPHLLAPAGGKGAAPSPGDLSLDAAERGAIAKALAETRGNKREAARRLGISATTLYGKIKGYGLEGK